MEQPTTSMRVPTPNATACLVLGILSLVLGGCFVVGLVLGIMGILYARKGRRDLAANPHHDGEGMITGGLVCSIIGVVVGTLQMLFFAGYVVLMLVLAMIEEPIGS